MRIDTIVVLVIIFLTTSCRKGTDRQKVNGDDKPLLDQGTTIDTSALRLTAHLLYQADQHEEAIDEYKKLIKYDSLNGQFNFRIGYCLALRWSNKSGHKHDINLCFYGKEKSTS